VVCQVARLGAALVELDTTIQNHVSQHYTDLLSRAVVYTVCGLSGGSAGRGSGRAGYNHPEPCEPALHGPTLTRCGL
jgi:hypothetical protein